MEPGAGSSGWSVGGFAAEHDLDGLGIEALRKDFVQILQHGGWQIDIMSSSGLLIMEMRVRTQVRAITRRPTLEIHGPDQIALNERFETVVNGGEGDGRELGFDADEHFVCGGVVAFRKQYAVNDLALRSRAKPAIGESLGERVRVFRWMHGIRKGQQIGMIPRRKR